MTPQQYVNRIRNPRKKAYAIAYLTYLNGGCGAPDFRQFDLSPMASQAVWLKLRSLVPQETLDAR